MTTDDYGYTFNIELIPSISEALGEEAGDRRRRYGELCSIALALDVVGERWTLLLVRELFAGPKRFTDLETGLPGLGTAVLSERLRKLERDGLIRRRQLGPPAPAALYELTPRGAALEPVLVGLARWGAGYLADGRRLASRGRWLLQAMAAVAAAPTPGFQPVNFVLDGEESHIRAVRERLAARDGLSAEAQATIRGAAHDLHLLATAAEPRVGPSSPFEVEGDRELADRVLSQLVLAFHQASASAQAPG